MVEPKPCKTVVSPLLGHFLGLESPSRPWRTIHLLVVLLDLVALGARLAEHGHDEHGRREDDQRRLDRDDELHHRERDRAQLRGENRESQLTGDDRAWPGALQFRLELRRIYSISV